MLQLLKVSLATVCKIKIFIVNKERDQRDTNQKRN